MTRNALMYKVPGYRLAELREAEADRDRLALRVAELEQELAEAKQSIKTIMKEDGAVVSRQAKLVAELDAALYNHGYGPRLCRCEWCAALAGDGGGACPHTGIPAEVCSCSLHAEDGGGA